MANHFLPSRRRGRSAMKRFSGTAEPIFPHHQPYALDTDTIATDPPAELTVKHIGDLIKYDLSALQGAAASDAQ
jgi:hypothetical protein